MDIRMFCQVVLTIYGKIPEILNHKSVKLITRGIKEITQITMKLTPDGKISNPLGIDFRGQLGLRVRACTWATFCGRYTQNVCDLHGRKLQPLYVNGEYAIFRYSKVALVQACHQTQSIRIITLCLKDGCVKAEEVVPWTNIKSEHIRTRADTDRFLRDFILKSSNKSQYLNAVLDALEWAERAHKGKLCPSFFLSRQEVVFIAA